MPSRFVAVYFGLHGVMKAIYFPEAVAASYDIYGIEALGHSLRDMAIRAAIMLEVAIAAQLGIWPCKGAKLLLAALIIAYTAVLLTLGLGGGWANECPCGVEIWGRAAPVWGAVVRNLILGTVVWIDRQ